ncbi:MAG: DNA polymerase III subunit gamma/tau [Gammaproteobacteria bacterium]|nr:DNA polymerase III subunit gamma/tau [Gammaproteobacteria bacterium]
MSYTVLARKWRPRSFEEMAGQEHVRRALTNALNDDRLHHAFLFTGTRGVGKTTIARILAKSLNCDKGVSSQPCGECANCREIDEGRFVDLIEVDAASRTKVDDTRELLDNVQYRPTRGTYKVYLIDEVHMLSKHSFNALLKTLEEPPEHGKFLLATTDPQKLPVTVLSRCLQFNLKKLPVDLIFERLQQICNSEEVPADEPGLMRIARAAAGSMRDGLSLLDQAIAFGAGEIKDDDVRAMLGSIDRQDVARLIEAVLGGDASAVFALVQSMDEHAPDYEMALVEMATLIQRAALAQAAPDAIDDSRGDREQVLALAAASDAEALQLLYQIALIGRRDLYLSGDPRSGFEMVLLRMLAFRPATAGDQLQTAPVTNQAAAAAANKKPSPPKVAPPKASAANSKSKPAKDAKPAPVAKSAKDPKPATAAKPAQANRPSAAPPQPPAQVTAPAATSAGAGDWLGLVEGLDVRGAAKQLAANCQLDRIDGAVWHLVLDQRHAHLLTENLRVRLRDALRQQHGDNVDVRVREGEVGEATLAAVEQKNEADRLQQARTSLENDPNVQALKDTFDATIKDDSVRPNDSVEDDRTKDLFNTGDS